MKILMETRDIRIEDMLKDFTTETDLYNLNNKYQLEINKMIECYADRNHITRHQVNVLVNFYRNENYVDFPRINVSLSVKEYDEEHWYDHEIMLYMSDVVRCKKEASGIIEDPEKDMSDDWYEIKELKGKVKKLEAKEGNSTLMYWNKEHQCIHLQTIMDILSDRIFRCPEDANKAVGEITEGRHNNTRYYECDCYEERKKTIEECKDKDGGRDYQGCRIKEKSK